MRVHCPIPSPSPSLSPSFQPPTPSKSLSALLRGIGRETADADPLSPAAGEKPEAEAMLTELSRLERRVRGGELGVGGVALLRREDESEIADLGLREEIGRRRE